MTKNEKNINIEDLLEKPYWIVDILPKQVPKDSEGQYFKIEEHYLKRMSLLCQKYADMLLKLNCYFDIMVSHDCEEWVNNPKPKKFVKRIGACMSENPKESSLFVYIKTGEVLMVINRDSTYLTLYNPTEEILSLIRQLATSEGLFVWQPTN